LFPKLSAYKSPLTQFMLSAFTYAHFFYKQLLLSQPDLGELNGALLIAHNEKEKKAQQNLTQWLTCYPELGELVDASHGYSASGLTIERDGLFIPLSGWINSPELCQYLIQNDGISLMTANPVDSLEFEDDHWLIDGIKTPVVILANGNKINSFEQTRHLPVRSIRGQMTSILSTTESSELRIPLCAEGHVLPAIQGCHSVGATYELGQSAAHTLKEDDIENLKKLDNITAHTVWSQKVVGHWAGIRASTPDYLPLLGPLVNYGEFHTQFQGLHNNSNRWIPQAGPYYPGLYVCAGFGSRGLTTIPLSAEWLAGFINNELSCLPGYLVKAVSTARFFRKNITRGITKG